METFVQHIITDLQTIHATTGLTQGKQEKAWCRQIANDLFGRGITAFASVGYPLNARSGNSAAPDECDLVLNVAPADWFWIEAKVIWRPGNNDYLWNHSARDVQKLRSLRRPEAKHVGFLLIGLDSSPKERMLADVDGRFTQATRLSQSWQRRYERFTQAGDYRVNIWFWWRGVFV